MVTFTTDNAWPQHSRHGLTLLGRNNWQNPGSCVTPGIHILREIKIISTQSLFSFSIEPATLDSFPATPNSFQVDFGIFKQLLLAQIRGSRLYYVIYAITLRGGVIDGVPFFLVTIRCSHLILFCNLLLLQA